MSAGGGGGVGRSEGVGGRYLHLLGESGGGMRVRSWGRVIMVCHKVLPLKTNGQRLESLSLSQQNKTA